MARRWGRSESDAAGDPQCKNQNYYRATEGMCFLWFHESKSIVTVQRRFRFGYSNCQSPLSLDISNKGAFSLPHSFNNFVRDRWSSSTIPILRISYFHKYFIPTLN
ncbi:hypothetical protein AVEN_170793-1 [Araneus ventricosus]|uniref:DUF4817 domain-containing protein n=1 Tax=Araneus ventricosus TaxID=182803 RepID=A0A4Y2PIE8_ARAVE|nr:hypothetical protein AVEN_170793-1 [Araneus ventricosus]